LCLKFDMMILVLQ